PEIYKLNVYSSKISFEDYKDIPRDTGMLGSLVIIYRTPHEGEGLTSRHKDREWTFDANTLTSLQSSPFLVYVAFYSVIEQQSH
ncbi:hypothetical protein BDM02DRAFT_3102798, partial [Thelephora ganbajun]